MVAFHISKNNWSIDLKVIFIVSQWFPAHNLDVVCLSRHSQSAHEEVHLASLLCRFHRSHLVAADSYRDAIHRIECRSSTSNSLSLYRRCASASRSLPFSAFFNSIPRVINYSQVATIDSAIVLFRCFVLLVLFCDTEVHRNWITMCTSVQSIKTGIAGNSPPQNRFVQLRIANRSSDDFSLVSLCVSFAFRIWIASLFSVYSEHCSLLTKHDVNTSTAYLSSSISAK